MRVIFSAILTSIALGVVAGLVFSVAQTPVYEAQPRSGVRVGDPGHNLVGPEWSGLYPTDTKAGSPP
jgi:uncharacterized protein involved in exopolysaccharide biosynthesis